MNFNVTNTLISPLLSPPIKPASPSVVALQLDEEGGYPWGKDGLV